MKKHLSRKKRKAGLSGGQFGKSRPLAVTHSPASVVREDPEEDFSKIKDKNVDAFLARLIENQEAYLNSEEKGIDMRPILRKYSMLPENVSDMSEHEVLRYLRFAVDMLARYHLCLTTTNHLSDRELLTAIVEKVLPQPIGIGPNPQGTLIYHQCCPYDAEEWYVHYGEASDREDYESAMGVTLPEPVPLVSDRDKWIELLAESFRDEPFPPLPE